MIYLDLIFYRVNFVVELINYYTVDTLLKLKLKLNIYKSIYSYIIFNFVSVYGFIFNY